MLLRCGISLVLGLCVVIELWWRMDEMMVIDALVGASGPGSCKAGWYLV